MPTMNTTNQTIHSINRLAIAKQWHADSEYTHNIIDLRLHNRHTENESFVRIIVHSVRNIEVNKVMEYDDSPIIIETERVSTINKAISLAEQWLHHPSYA